MYALINDSQLILGPIGYNYRMINSDLEELEIEERVSPRDYERVPIRFDDKTWLVSVVQNIPQYDSRFQSVGNFEWNIIKENDIPVRVEMTYEINDKTLDQIKEEYKTQVKPIRKSKENTNIQLTINDSVVTVTTSKEERLIYLNKLFSYTEPINFKFTGGIWTLLTEEDMKYIIQEIDKKVQEAFDWEHSKIQEIDSCTTGEEVYNVILVEPQQVETPNALPTNN